VYTDRDSIFQPAAPRRIEEELHGTPERTQFGRALAELGIEWIPAYSPQAKGRIERLFETLQDRLVKEMRLAGMDMIADANWFLETHFLPRWEERFTVAPRRPKDGPAPRCAPHAHSRSPASGVPGPAAGGHTVKWEGRTLGRAAPGRVCQAAQGARGNRTTTRWLALAAFPRPLSAAGDLPGSAATIGKSFRPPLKANFLAFWGR
jgi:hypothetical protein